MDRVAEICFHCLGNRVEFAEVSKAWDGRHEWVLQDCTACRGSGLRTG